ncbi:electron transport complex subunit RsxC [Mangrovimicrobium sediminis]|uniref:Ion-translocating oxidoreductase complex subunit C n=1 Tax=Mangrovimicrobium sediminis TaxID=2562682 RepID=A0A4Z0M6N1_9GAMM|nr:electron transport complex subunit RsxC [Haliea sp. SAOS-164]TGD75066.1 electron transport complex subunit RsxC [Haliea sp. SAOS-164]
MSIFSPIRGGVHPEGRKGDTAGQAILTDIPLPARLSLPLFQQAGASALPVVQVGERVAKGQCIGVSGAGLSTRLHAPTSGSVVAIEDIVAPHPSGLPATSIIIEPDGEDRWQERPREDDPFARSPEELAEEVERAGIVGLGGAVFPAAIKLRQGRRYEIRTLIINGGECEPYLTTDDHLMRERAAQIVEGARLIQHIVECYEVIIGIEDNKPEAVAAMREAAAPFGKVEVKTVPAMYPMGSAKQLIQALTGREVPAGGRSNDLGILVHNVATAYAIQQALRHGRPLLSRVLTLAGGCVSRPRNVEALFGTPIEHLLEQCGGLRDTPARLVMGGPMMGQALPSTAVPVMKGTSGVLALTRREVNDQAPSPCIRCGRCVDACPMGLMPVEMAKFARADDFDGAAEYGLRDCILCGTCSWVCPSHIPLVNFFEYARGEMKQRRAAAQKLEYTQRLTEARNARLEREAEEKRAAKAARAAKKKKPARRATAKADNEASTTTSTEDCDS